MLHRIALFALFGAACVFPAAQDPDTVRGLDHYLNLEYDQAIADYRKASVANPQAAGPHNHIAQALLYREMFRNGALESQLVSGNNSFLRRPKMNTPPQVEKQFESEIQKAISLSQARLDKNPNDTGALYDLGVAYALKSNDDFLVRKAWKDALSEATTARKLHNKVTAIDPSNYDARLVQGVHDYVVGSLPWTFKALGFLVGFRGDKEEGIRTLEEVSKKASHNAVDAEILLCALYRREGHPKKALPLLADLVKRYPRNYLLRFEQAQMYGAIGDKSDALATIATIAGLKKAGSPGYANIPWEKIYYEEGNVEFWYKDFGGALDSMKKVTASPKDLDLNTGVLAYLRQGQIYDLTNRHGQAVEAYKQAIAFAPEAEAAKEAKRYIGSPYKRES
ncbi:MAG: tetratricopeptide repeat protein [Bryobacteraceae bacterium]